MEWFKFFGKDYLSDPKILSLNALQRSCWITLLSYACSGDNGGVIKYLNEERLLEQSGIHLDEYDDTEWKRAKGVLKVFVDNGMITYDNGIITILNWQKRQGSSLTGYERVKRWREKKRMITPDNKNDNNRIEKKRSRIEKNNVSPSGDAVESQFLMFWEKYPKKVGKGAALAAWRKVKRPPLSKLLAALETQVGSSQWKRENGQFIPHPSTWLNQGRWDDEIISAVNKVDKF